jgi:hypothetical protein
VTPNLYGDDLGRAEGPHGVEIARQRMDDLDRESIEYALELGAGTALDLGCGSGIQGVRFAALGLETLLIDTLPRERTLLAHSHLERALPIRYLERDARSLRDDELPERIDLAYSQRFLHHLAWPDALTLLTRLRARMPAGSKMFISASGLGSELGEGYIAGSRPVSSRYGELAPAMANKHQITGPVCLYTPDELALLGETAGFHPERVRLSEFGNVKGVLVARAPEP